MSQIFEEVFTMAAEPEAALGAVRAEAAGAVPEIARMVGMFEMCDFMGNQIINDGFRSKDDPPVVIDIVAGRAAAPAGFGVFYRDVVYFTVEQGGFLPGKDLKLFGGELLQKIFNPAMQKLFLSGDFEAILRKSCPAAILRTMTDLIFAAENRNNLAVPESDAFGKITQVAVNPIAVAFNKI